jgi:ribosomal-protein-alanine N-acetyltransferase
VSLADGRIADFLTCQVALVDGWVAGFIVVGTTAPGEHEILNMVVDSAQRRRGVARRLLRAVIAADSGVWFLDVRDSNTAAQALYKSFGFESMGRRENYYVYPSEAAIVMGFYS